MISWGTLPPSYKWVTSSPLNLIRLSPYKPWLLWLLGHKGSDWFGWTFFWTKEVFGCPVKLTNMCSMLEACQFHFHCAPWIDLHQVSIYCDRSVLQSVWHADSKLRGSWWGFSNFLIQRKSSNFLLPHFPGSLLHKRASTLILVVTTWHHHTCLGFVSSVV